MLSAKSTSFPQVSECDTYLFLTLCLRELEFDRKMFLLDSFFCHEVSVVIVFHDENVEEVIILGLMDRTVVLMTLDLKLNIKLLSLFS